MRALDVRVMAKRREKGKIPHAEWSAIRTRHAAGESLASIARDYDCTGPAIRYIINRSPDGEQAAPAEAPRVESAPAAPASQPLSPSPSSAPPARPVPQAAAPAPSDRRPGASPIDPDLRWRVSRAIASFLTVFDSFLTTDSPDRFDHLLDATDRLMRAAARMRIEVERARAMAVGDGDAHRHHQGGAGEGRAG